MQLMTSRQNAETHGINYHKILYLHKIKKIIQEFGLNINRVNKVRERDDIKPANQQGERTVAGKNCFYDVELLIASYNRRMRKVYAKRIPGHPVRDRSKPKKTALDYRMEGRKLAWIATKMRCDIYDVMKELGIA